VPSPHSSGGRPNLLLGQKKRAGGFQPARPGRRAPARRPLTLGSQQIRRCPEAERPDRAVVLIAEEHIRIAARFHDAVRLLKTLRQAR